MTITSALTAQISDLLTVIITTSPTPSAPSTELITAVLASFQAQCPALIQCPVQVVFDHYDQIVDAPRLKKGFVSQEQADAYAAYKQNVKTLVNHTYLAQTPAWVTSQVEAEFGSPLDSTRKNSVLVDITSTADGKVTFIEPPQRLGFGLAVRTALRAATTPYVWVHQHDWTLEAPVPVAQMLEVMDMSKNDALAPVKYVCLPSCRMLDYAISDHVTRYPKLNALTQLLKRDFATSSGSVVHMTPLFFWHDKPHIAEREHYLARVFPSRLAIMRGAFIEDSIGQRARDQMKDGQWSKWACWLLYPPVLGMPFVRHMHGRMWRGAESTRLMIERQKEVWQQGGRERRDNRTLSLKGDALETEPRDESV